MHKTALLALVAGATFCPAADGPAPPPANKSALIFSDDFNRADLGDAWRITTPAFTIADGVLKASQTRVEHSAVGMVKVGRKDLLIEFKFRLDGASSINAVCNDRDYKDGHAGHICRVSLSPGRILLGDDKERLRHEIEAMRKDPARKAEADRLVAGRTASVPANIERGQWYRLSMEIIGDEMRVSLDDHAIGFLKSSGLAHPMKSDFYFAVSGRDALFDDLRIRDAGAGLGTERAASKKPE